MYEALAAQLQSILPSPGPAEGAAGYSETQARELQHLQGVVRELFLGVKSLSELYRTCDTYKLWELCLRLLHVSRNDNVNLIQTLYRSIIYRCVLWLL